MSPSPPRADGGPAAAVGGSLAGSLRVVPGSPQPIQGGRPVLSARALQALTHGVPAAAYPDRMAMLFGLCGTAHRITARRALQAAQQARPGLAAPDAVQAADEAVLALWTAREHLQRLALDLPQRLPVGPAPADAGWLRGHPLERLPADGHTADEAALRRLHAALRPWLETHVLGGPADDWLEAWHTDCRTRVLPADTALHAWAAARPQAAQRWLHGAAAAGSHALPSRALPAAQCEPAALAALAQRLFDDPGFAQQPTWENEPAETGCWTRESLPSPHPGPHNAWMRWQYRIAELVALSADDGAPVLAGGAIALGDGVGLAWAEMSRGLLVHAVRLQQGGAGAVVDQGRVLAPTEWNFHPAGGLAQALADPACGPTEARAAVAALDPCVDVQFATPADTPTGAHRHA